MRTYPLFLFITLFAAGFFILPAQAKDDCPTLTPGMHVKVSGHAAIYAINHDTQLLHFPSGDEYKSWRADNSYTDYTTISESCFDTIPLPTRPPNGVTFRSGSFVVKRSSSPQLYVVEPHNTLHKISHSVAEALYGDRIKTLLDVSWSDYTVSAEPEITTPVPHRGMFFYDDRNYYVMDALGKRRLLTKGAITANRIKQDFFKYIGEQSIVDIIPIGEPIITLDSALSNGQQVTSSVFSLIPPTLAAAPETINGFTSALVRPSFAFELVGPANQKLRYRIQVDDTADFSSPVIDYISQPLEPGLSTFETGQRLKTDASYLAGDSEQILDDTTYYWHVQSIAANAEKSLYTAPQYFVVTTQNLPLLPLHFVVISSDSADLGAKDLDKILHIVNQNFMSDKGQALVRFTNKNPILYEEFSQSSCALTIIPSKNPTTRKAACNDKKIIDPGAINVFVTDAVQVSSATLNGPYINYKTDRYRSKIDYVLAHELGHVFGLSHTCFIEGTKSNIMGDMQKVGCKPNDIPSGFYFDEKQVARINKRALHYAELFAKYK